MNNLNNKSTNKILDINKLNEIFNLKDLKESIDNYNQISTNLNLTDQSKVYDELSKLIQNGNFILETLKYHVENNLDNAELINGIANIMNSIRDTLKEFTKIYLNQIQFEQKLQIEKLRLAGRKELLDAKIKATNNLLNIQNNNQSIPLIPYTPENIIKEIIEIEKEEEKLKEKENK